ncbi:MAG: hypothetical protein ABH829_03345 [archaeon]
MAWFRRKPKNIVEDSEVLGAEPDLAGPHLSDELEDIKREVGEYKPPAVKPVLMPALKPIEPAEQHHIPFSPAKGMPPAPKGHSIDDFLQEYQFIDAGQKPAPLEPKKFSERLLPTAEVTIDAPELVRAFVELLAKPSTATVVDVLAGNKMSVQELVRRTELDEVEVKSVLHRFVALGLARESWVKTPSGEHINKFELVSSRGEVRFDLRDLSSTLSVDALNAKSARLVELVSKEGKIPQSLAMKELDLADDRYFEQVLRYTERFKLPEIRKAVSEVAEPTAEEAPSGPSSAAVRRVVRKAKLSSSKPKALDEIEHYMKDL